MSLLDPHVPGVMLGTCLPKPFEKWPQLQTIWPEPYASEAAEASDIDWLSTDEPIMPISVAGEVVGITGWFYMEKPWRQYAKKGDVYLRWHGIVPEHRRKGYAAEALRQVLVMLLGRATIGGKPIRQLVELAPHNEYGRTVAAPFFEAMGFVNEGKTIYCGEPQYRYVRPIV